MPHVLLLFFPHQVVAVLALIYLAFISGFLHLDGLADSADGLLSARPREDCLRIMKDSRTGAMGVVVVVCTLLAKYSALSAMDACNAVPGYFFHASCRPKCNPFFHGVSAVCQSGRRTGQPFLFRQQQIRGTGCLSLTDNIFWLFLCRPTSLSRSSRLWG